MNSRSKFVIVTSSTFLVVLLLLGAAMGRSAAPDDAYRHLTVYTEVLSRIKSEYVEEPDIKSVTLGAMNGMLEAIDPFASYLNPEQYKQYLNAQTAKKPSVGMTVSRRFGYVGVVNVIPGSSAWKAGLTTGDMLESIAGVATRDMPLAYAEMLLHGDAGSSVEVSVLRVRKPEPQKITLTRGVWKLPAVTSRMLPDGIGLVQAPALADGRVKEVAQHIENLQKQGTKGVILDLRNSGFGKPEDGIALADLFLEKGQIGYVEGQKVKREEFNADPGALLKGVKLVVLTNRGTANAAEIAAAALLDSKRAEIVGEKTYGDAAIRRPVTMDDGSAVLLSVAKYHSPSGSSIQDSSVTPTYLVSDAEPVAEAEEVVEGVEPEVGPPAPRKDEDDQVLKRAVELLTKGAPDKSVAAQPAARDLESKDPQVQNPPLTIEKK